ncbi:histidine-type phosphatase [Caulobacter flavus]|uniref:Histidine-type phosphatase n=1 Tax=Caulobacter flavus TaxID=1679497 RepID=A0A2N5CWV4_9CAUL|nr:histidine-type phosphatase [Caulobacter flavus]AYV47437.1 histidine-type phosphatase [Caulobacter flavus]PLR18280.1 histidine-type phosphatase [Caulobacter flavus]
MRLFARLALAALAVLSTTPAAADTLEKVVVVTRHGVRAAMSSPERLETATARPWPRFSVPAGHLTANGAELSTLFGGYYRALYEKQGLLAGAGCGQVYYWANVTQRTIATAKALGQGLSPGCAVEVHNVGEGKVDPMFEPVTAGVVKADVAKARAAVSGRVGGDLAAWSAAHRDAVDSLDELLMQCDAAPCPAAPGKRRIFDAKPGFSAEADATVGIEGPEAFASGVTESLLMAWADGQDFASLGWKGLGEASLLRVFPLHQAEFDLRLRTPEVARIGASHLATRVLATLDDGPDAVGGKDAKMVMIVGHDGTLAMLGGLLGLDWTAPGYQPGQIAPGGALVFERWKRDDGARVIRARYTVQTLSQLREKKALTLAAPPASSPIFVPRCSEASLDCPLDRFGAVVKAAVAP